MDTLKKLVDDAMDMYGYVTANDGVYIYSKDSIIEEQKQWDDSDKCKCFDFSTCNFWIVSGHADPVGFETFRDALAAGL